MGVAALSLPIVARAGMSPEGRSGKIDPSGDTSQIETASAEPLYKIFFDERFAECRAFADELKRHGRAGDPIRGDITDVWFNDLYYRWKQQPVAIAGMTAAGPIFCLEMLARDAGMRVVMRADHRFSPQRGAAEVSIEHEISASANILAPAEALQQSGDPWPARMAEIVMQFPAFREQERKLNISGSGPRGNNDPDHLVTWVIAPMRRA